MILPKLPKLFSGKDGPGLAARVYDWVSPAHDLLAALKKRVEDLDTEITVAVEAAGSAHASTHLPGESDALTTAAAGTIQPDDTASEGSAISFSRSDHRHAITAAAPSQGIGGSNAEGSASSFARSDHDHTVRETGGPTNLTVGAIADGQQVVRSGSALVGEDPPEELITYWEPDVPPEGSAHADSDEFEGTSSLTGWTIFDPNSLAVATGKDQGFGYLKKSGTATSNGRMVAAYKAVPSATDWAFATKLHAACAGTGGTIRWGIFLAEDLTVGSPSTGNFYVGSVLHNTSVIAGTLADYQAAFTATATVNRVDRSVYLRCRVSTPGGVPTAAWDWSDDGVGWNQLISAAVGFTPVHYGWWIRNAVAGGADAILRNAWFRTIEDTVSLDELLPGGREIGFFSA